jgi:hypothetical protein
MYTEDESQNQTIDFSCSIMTKTSEQAKLIGLVGQSDTINKMNYTTLARSKTKLVAILTRISFMGEVEQIHAEGGKDHPTYQTSNHMDPIPNQSSIDLPVYHNHLMNK